jgi:hypothetical protein
MEYSTPELTVLGTVAVLVLGGDVGLFDNGATPYTRPIAGMALGLDE